MGWCCLAIRTEIEKRMEFGASGAIIKFQTKIHCVAEGMNTRRDTLK
jgi:hypothetical protein